MINEPYIFILDLDGTIIGNCVYQILLYNINQLGKIGKVCKKPLLESYNETSKLIRPYFLYFIKKIKSKFPDSLFFIYTASSKDWAKAEINMIEKENGIKFNRPIFTRDDCILSKDGIYNKSINHIIPKIKKYNKNIQINSKKLLIIDDNKVYIDYQKNLLICPNYGFIKYINVGDLIKREHLNNEKINTYVKNCIDNNNINPYCIDKGDKNEELKYKWVYKKMKEINNINKPYNKDKFWKKLTKTIINK